LSNALSYTPEGGAIRLDVREDEGAAVLCVRDTGHGFSDTERAIVGEGFVRFYRSGAPSGAGLGLAIATALARGMGGALAIGSARGAGTVAELRLPKAG
jgi:signal transduction histidine kinase